MRNEINPTDLARNRWRGILTGLGIDEAVLSGKHTSCPICGGKDRFRFDNKDGAGTYYCNGCGAGTGYNLLMKVNDIDFPEALKRVKEVLGEDTPEDPPEKKLDMPERRASLKRLWESGQPNHPETIRYLTGRGLSEKVATAAAEGLRYVEKAWHRDRKEFMPAMIGLMCKPRGGGLHAVSIHRTFFLPDGGREKKFMPPVGEIHGSAVWFGSQHRDTWVIGEGIETTLAGAQMAASLYGKVTAVAACSASGIEHLQIPGAVRNVVLLADNDASFTGQAVCFQKAHQLYTRKSKPNVTVWVPRRSGCDILDCLDISQKIDIHGKFKRRQ